jgi:hypothetical protein
VQRRAAAEINARLGNCEFDDPLDDLFRGSETGGVR